RHATQDEFVWTHSWRAGDVLLWDNRCALHHRTELDHTRPRVLHRTQIQGEAVIAG
ncbi:MAG: TauD/TfdA family dioxygenase, partial [Pseudomonadota bacterium]|nr:TauD/TfdA family dioxygenase [Pseudomonadota bacterium]